MNAIANLIYYQFVLYVVMWPGTEQILYKTPPIPDSITDFTYHGLWPSNNNGSYPSYCNNSYHFNMSEIESLKKQLTDVWYSYQDPKHISRFWAHEFDKHGTCLLNVLPTEWDFFNTAIWIHSQMRTVETFDSQGIQPSFDRTYNLSDFIRASQSKFPKITPLIHCYFASKKAFLDTVSYCLQIHSSSSYDVYECDREFLERHSTNCPESGIYYPPIEYQKRDDPDWTKFKIN